MSTPRVPPGSAARVGRELGRLAADFGGESRALRRRAFWRLAARFTPTLAVERDGVRLFVGTEDRTLGRRLFVYPGAPERDIQQAFAALAMVPGGPPPAGATVVEIGANIGSHTVQLLTGHAAGHVVAIEPHPRNCELLRQNLLVNGLSDRVTVVSMALSDHDGEVTLEQSATNSGDHRVRVPGAATGPEARRPTITIPAARLDTLVAQGVVDPAATGLVWIDAQGHEAHILRGAGCLLGSEIPIVLEYWPYGLRRAGGLEALHELVTHHYSHVIDVSPPGGAAPRILPARHLPRLEAEYGWDHSGHPTEAGTDLVLSAAVAAVGSDSNLRAHHTGN